MLLRGMQLLKMASYIVVWASYQYFFVPLFLRIDFYLPACVPLYLWVNMCEHVCVGVCMCVYTFGSQKRESEPFELELQVIVSYPCRSWESNSVPLQEQQVLPR